MSAASFQYVNLPEPPKELVQEDHVNVKRLATVQKLMNMRRNQVDAVQHLVKWIGDANGNGVFWHMIGSGKTLTSVKASSLLKENYASRKCVFLGACRGIKRQTRKDSCSSGNTSCQAKARRVSAGSPNQYNLVHHDRCVQQNTSTADLVRRLLSDDYAEEVIVSTNQKLGQALYKTRTRNT